MKAAVGLEVPKNCAMLHASNVIAANTVIHVLYESILAHMAAHVVVDGSPPESFF